MLHRSGPLSLLVAILTLVGCADRVDDDPVDRNPLTLADGKPVCDTDEITDLLDAGAFPNSGLTNAIDVHCGQVEDAETDEEKVEKAFETADQILELLADGQVNPLPPDFPTAEEVAAALIAAFLELAGVDTTDRIAIETIEPTDLPEDVVTPDGESALFLDEGDLAGPVVAAILPVESPPGGECPFDFDPPEDCWPQAWDWSFTPVENVVANVDGWLCLDSTVLPSGVPESRIEIASEDQDNPGTLRFWGNTPEDVAPDDFVEFCPDEQPIIDIGSRPGGSLGYAWDLADMFRVTPAYASPGRLGASIGAFSVFTPADPVTTGTGTISGIVFDNTTEAAIPGATVTLLSTDFLTTTSANGFYSFTGVPFDTYTVEASAPGFTTETKTVTISSTTPTATADIGLDPIVIVVE